MSRSPYAHPGHCVAMNVGLKREGNCPDLVLHRRLCGFSVVGDCERSPAYRIRISGSRLVELLSRSQIRRG